MKGTDKEQVVKTAPNTNWETVGESSQIPGVLVNIDSHGEVYFQARFTVSESQMRDGVQCFRQRDSLGKPVYLNSEVHSKHPDFAVAARVVETVWPTIQTVVQELSVKRGN